MPNRKLALIVKQQSPVLIPEGASVRDASRQMWDRCVGSVLVVDDRQSLVGIFTGRDAVKVLADGRDPASTCLADAMTRNPVTISPDKRAIDALHIMAEGGFRHLPVVVGGQIRGVISRGDFKGDELGQIDVEQHLWETLW